MSVRRMDAIVPIALSPLTSPTVVGGIQGRVLSAIICVDNRLRGSLFVARILNSSAFPIFCTVYGESASGAVRALPPYEFRVDAGGTEDAQIVVPRRPIDRVTRVFVSMRGEQMEYRIDARVPSWRPPARVAWSGVVLAAAAALALSRAGTVSVGETPAQVLGGALVRVPYVAVGLGSVHYDVTRDGATIASGPLAPGTGAFMFESGDQAGILRASVTLQQAGETRTSTSAPIVVDAAAAPPEIQFLSVSPSQAQPGDRIDVRYRLDAQHADVALLDPHGRVVEQSPLGSTGSAMLTAPSVDRAQAFTVRVTAVRAARQTSTEAPLRVAPRPTAAPAPLAPAAPAAVTAASQLVQLAQPYAVGGTALPINILARESSLTLTLQDPLGQTVSRVDVDPGQSEVNLDVPPVADDETFVLVVTVNDGEGEQSFLLHVPVRAH